MKYFVVTITQSIEARDEGEAKNILIDKVIAGNYDAEQIEAEEVEESEM